MSSENKNLPQRWLWKGHLKEGTLNAVVGGAETSSVVAMTAAHVSKGEDWPDGSACPLRRVIWCAIDIHAMFSSVRLRAAGADMGQVICAALSPPFDDREALLESFTPVVKEGDVIFLDAVGFDDNATGQGIRACIEPLFDLCGRVDATVVAASDHASQAAAANASMVLYADHAGEGGSYTLSGHSARACGRWRFDLAMKHLEAGDSSAALPGEGRSFVVTPYVENMVWSADQ